MSEGGVLHGIFQFLKSIFWLAPTTLSESRDLREQIEEEKPARRERKPKEA